eukprot:569940-Pelagomonas_calceolata.AAC.1
MKCMQERASTGKEAKEEQKIQSVAHREGVHSCSWGGLLVSSTSAASLLMPRSRVQHTGREPTRAFGVIHKCSIVAYAKLGGDDAVANSSGNT